MARDGMAGASVDQQRFFLRALVLGLPAPRAEPATARRRNRARYIALQHDPRARPFEVWLRHGHRRQQRLGIGMARLTVFAETLALPTPGPSGPIDISPGGCYVEIISPFPPGTVIDIIVRTGHLKVRLKGKVRSAHMGYGMGVEFVLNGPDEKAQVKKLLELQIAESQNALSVEQE